MPHFILHKFTVELFFPDNVCIESLSLKITRKRLDKCNENIDHLESIVQRFVSFNLALFPNF